MKASPRFLSAILLCATLATAHAQRGGPGMGGPGGGSGPNFNSSLGKLFGDNTAFSASIEIKSKDVTTSDTVTFPGKLSYDKGKSRFEMDMSKATGKDLAPGAIAQMKSMGMETMTMISVPEKKMNYMIYPGLNSYAEIPMDEAEASIKLDQFKIEITEQGKETLDGHACVKNKAVVTDDKGEKHESTTWNATDLNKFPIKVVMTEKGQEVTMSYKDVKLSKPDAKAFEPPATMTKYDSVMQMMQTEIMKRVNRGRGGGQ